MPFILAALAYGIAFFLAKGQVMIKALAIAFILLVGLSGYWATRGRKQN